MFEPHFTGHDDESTDEEDIAKFYDDVMVKMLLVRAARWEEVRFLNTFPVCKNVPDENAKGKECVLFRWCDVNKRDSSNMAVSSRLVGREFRWKGRFMQGTIAAAAASGMSFTGFRPVDDDKGGSSTFKLLVLDVSRAHFHPPAVRALPEWAATPGMVGTTSSNLLCDARCGS